MAIQPARLLTELESLRLEFGGDVSDRKRTLLRQLSRRRLPRSDHVRRLHELLCFMRAYPDSAEVLVLVESTLTRFASRADLRAHRDGLTDSGIAGTPIHFSFFAASALWIAEQGRRTTPGWETVVRNPIRARCPKPRPWGEPSGRG